MVTDYFAVLEKQVTTLLSKTGANVDQVSSEQGIHGEQCGGEAAAKLTLAKLWRTGVLGACLENPAVGVTVRAAPH